MAHGLARMERMILEALGPSKRLRACGELAYRGMYATEAIHYREPGVILRDGMVEFPDDRNLYDFRAVKALIVRAMGGPSPILDTTVRRARENLIKRGYLGSATKAGYSERRYVKAVKPQVELTIPELIKAISQSVKLR
jgi:hypothetical protein